MPRQAETNYLDGYRNGHLDRLIGTYSVIARTRPEAELPGYSRGYEDGWHGRENVAMAGMTKPEMKQ